MNMSVPSEWQVLVSLSTDKTVKLLSHVVKITVYSLSITWCNLYGNSLDDSYCILTCRKAALFMYAIYPFQKFKTLYCMWDIDCKRLFRNVWIIEDMVDFPIFSCTLQPASAIVRPWLTTWSTTVALISSLSLASSASSSVLPLYPSTMHPYSSSSSRLLTLIIFWMFIHCQNL